MTPVISSGSGDLDLGSGQSVSAPVAQAVQRHLLPEIALPGGRSHASGHAAAICDVGLQPRSSVGHGRSGWRSDGGLGRSLCFQPAGAAHGNQLHDRMRVPFSQAARCRLVAA
jgi:hypothetical protein